MNKWLGMGRLTRDPEIRITDTGKHVARFVIAINYSNSNGDDHAEFVQCEAWERTADVINDYLGRGDKVLVEGYIHTRKYTKEGEKNNRFFTYVIVRRLEFADLKSKNKEAAEYNQQSVPDMPSGSLDEWPPLVDPSLDIPF